MQQIADLFGVPRTTVYGHLEGSGQRPRGAAAVVGPVVGAAAAAARSLRFPS